ncbi:GNAT family N-acetyltransferase [Ottowia thiooxydans]|uniref:GNAT family N-acetyltransferase n=1 Tax=Ottowia thiooxydans TaxID=219182 RepID=UPI00048FFFF1|nr:GNAT family protein [Ottowia thiooxydans]
MPFPTLTTDRLILRQTSLADVDSLFRMFSDPAVVEFYDIEALQNRVQAEEIIDLHHRLFESKRGVRWGIALRESGTLVGTAGFFGKIEAYSSALLGYDLSPVQWRKGIMVEALRAILNYGFSQYGLNRIQATTDLDSSRSIATLKRVGFQEEGVLRESGFWKGQFHDVRCFSLLRSEWTTNRPL